MVLMELEVPIKPDTTADRTSASVMEDIRQVPLATSGLVENELDLRIMSLQLEGRTRAASRLERKSWEIVADARGVIGGIARLMVAERMMEARAATKGEPLVNPDRILATRLSRQRGAQAMRDYVNSL